MDTMENRRENVNTFDFRQPTEASVLICCGGFEVRSLAFARRLRKGLCRFQAVVILRYQNQKADNDANYQRLSRRLEYLIGRLPLMIDVDMDKPQETFIAVRNGVRNVLSEYSGKVIVDISGMTHLLAIGSLDASITSGCETKVVYTEAKTYYPLKGEVPIVLQAWKERNYKEADKYLQSMALKSVDIVPEFQGNLRPGRKICLLIFAGYEPNRLEGLVEDYAPSALIVLYGKSPHTKTLGWRTNFSKRLHADVFQGWPKREVVTDTIRLHKILADLESEFNNVRQAYDVAITPHCSKMQGVATYLFWRKHPEVQIVFTSPVRFNPKRYSSGSGHTFHFNLADYVRCNREQQQH